MSRTFLGAAAALVCGVLLLVPVVPAWAHHSFASEYDVDMPAKLQGTVKKVEWINPHSWITMDVKGPDGTVQTWEIEAGAPNAMFRRGFNKDSLALGTEIVVTGSREERFEAHQRPGSYASGRAKALHGHL